MVWIWALSISMLFSNDSVLVYSHLTIGSQVNAKRQRRQPLDR